MIPEPPTRYVLLLPQHLLGLLSVASTSVYSYTPIVKPDQSEVE